MCAGEHTLDVRFNVDSCQSKNQTALREREKKRENSYTKTVPERERKKERKKEEERVLIFKKKEIKHT